MIPTLQIGGLGRMRKATASGSTDPFWANVTSLLHMEGSNGGTTFTDQRANTWTRQPNSVTSNSVYKFGTTSMFVSGGRISSTTAIGVGGFGTGDFTVEGWFYANSTTTRGIFDAALAGSASSVAVGWDQASLKWQVYFAGTVYSSVATTLTLSTWTHFALVRNGTACVLYIGGVAVVSFTSGTSVSYAGMTVGAYFNSTFLWVGFIDEFRVTKGVARYTSAFTPPASQFPDS